MSVQVLCPSCATVVELHRPPVTDCPHCHTSYPETLRGTATQALRHSAAPKPALLQLGQWFSLLSGAVFLLLLLLAPFDLASYSIEGEPVSGLEFLRRGGIAFALIGGTLLAIGVGLLRDRAWARPLMMFYWLASGVSLLSVSGFEVASALAGVLTSAIPAAVAWWYLYAKEDVVAYFEARQSVVVDSPQSTG